MGRNYTLPLCLKLVYVVVLCLLLSVALFLLDIFIHVNMFDGHINVVFLFLMRTSMTEFLLLHQEMFYEKFLDLVISKGFC